MSLTISQREGFEHYRATNVGKSLIETLDGLIEEQRMQPTLALKVMKTFDRVISEALIANKRGTFTAKKCHLTTYNHTEDVLQMTANKGIFKLSDGKEFEAKDMKIIAMRAHDAHPSSR